MSHTDSEVVEEGVRRLWNRVNDDEKKEGNARTTRKEKHLKKMGSGCSSALLNHLLQCLFIGIGQKRTEVGEHALE